METKWFSSLARIALALALTGGLTFGAVGRAASAVGVIYVDLNAVGSNNGTSWANAYEDLGVGIGVATSGQQVWVAKGTYKPGNSRFSSFVLKRSGVGVYGGFAGTETVLTQRKPALNVTILSGEIGAAGNADNLYHVFQSGGTDGTAILDGFTIMGGNANGAAPYDDRGGGIYTANGGLKLVNITFSNNHANVYGGAMYNSGGGPVLNNVKFTNNSASYSTSWGAGGAIYNDNSSPTLTNVTFTGNSGLVYAGAIYNANGSNPTLVNAAFSGNSGAYGGAVYNDSSTPMLRNVTFAGNSAFNGGAMYTSNASPILTNVTFSGNNAHAYECDGFGGFGGGMLDWANSSPTLRNVTFSGNTAACGGDGLVTAMSGTPHIYNSIFWGDGDTEIVNAWAMPSVIVDSIVQGGCPSATPPSTCTHVLNADPKLGPLQNNGGFTKTMALGGGSAAIDAGGVSSTCPTKDQRGVSRPQGGKCDMGAYEVKALTFASVGTYDGWVLESGENTSVGGSMQGTATVFRVGDDASNRQFRGLLSFNTAGVPDAATIVQATVKVKKHTIAGTDPFTTHGALRVDLKKPYFGTALGLELSDFQGAATVGATATIGSTLVSGWYAGLLNSAGRAAVNKTGTTQLRLRFAVDDNNDLGADYVQLYSGNATYAYRPMLIVYYNP